MDGVDAITLLFVSLLSMPSSGSAFENVTMEKAGFEVIGGHFITIDEYLAKINDDTQRYQTRYLLQECPDTKLCGVSLEGVPSTGLGCCITCSCNATCHLTQSCCPHVYYDFPSSISPNTDMTCNYAELAKAEDYYGEQYLFYTACPEGVDPAQKVGCETRGFAEEASFADVVPVSDVSRNVNYINRHCAACHGARSEALAVWKVHIQCRFGNSDWSNLAKLVAKREDCGLIFKPPDDLDVTSLRCSTGSVSTCNLTGRWDMYDPLLDTACHGPSLRYALDMADGQRKIYRNPFCAMCNGEDIHRNIQLSMCSSDDLNNLLILLVSVSLTATEQTEDDCSSGEIFDPILGRCRSLDCAVPLQLVSSERACVSAIEYISSCVFSVPFKVNVSGEPLLLQSIDAIGNFVRDSMDKNLNNMHYGVSVCAVDFFFKINHSNRQVPTLDISSQIETSFILAHFQVRLSDPTEQFQRIVTGMINSSTDIGGTYLAITHGYVDALLQTPRVLLCDGFSTLTLNTPLEWMGQQSVSTATLFEDPYDHLTIVGGLRYPPSADCETEAQLYDSGFIDCPILVYDLHKTGMKRVPSGLMLRETLIEFGQFQSVNESHVAVCFETVTAKFVWSNGYRQEPNFGVFNIVCIIGVTVNLLLD